MPFTAVTPGPDHMEESYIESPTLTQADESGDNLENNDDIVPDDASDAIYISEKTENNWVDVSTENIPLDESRIEEEMLKVYRTVLDGNRAMSEVWYANFPIYMHSLVRHNRIQEWI